MRKKLIIGYASDGMKTQTEAYREITNEMKKLLHIEIIDSIKVIRFSTVERLINYMANGSSLDIGILDFIKNEMLFLLFTVEYSSWTPISIKSFPYLLYKTPKPIDVKILTEIVQNDGLFRKKYSNNYCFLNDIHGLQKLYYQDIYYIETEGRYVHIYTKDGSIHHNINLKTFENRLSREFYRCHGSYIINLNYIEKIAGNEVKMIDGTIIPIGKHKRKQFVEYYKKYMNEMVIPKNSIVVQWHLASAGKENDGGRNILQTNRFNRTFGTKTDNWQSGL